MEAIQSNNEIFLALENVQKYKTLSFKTKKQAIKNRNEIVQYFNERITDININEGVDERGNNGYYVYYILNSFS